MNALVRAYRLGQQRLLQSAYDFITADDELPADLASAVFQRLVDEVSEYIDWMSEKVALLYEQEREAWLANRTTARESQVRDIIEGGDVDAAAAAATLGYSLTARHVAVVAWTHHSAPDTINGLARFTSAINAAGAAMGSPRSSLVISRDQDTAWGWITVPESWEYEESLGDRSAGDIRPTWKRAAGRGGRRGLLPSAGRALLNDDARGPRCHRHQGRGQDR